MAPLRPLILSLFIALPASTMADDQPEWFERSPLVQLVRDATSAYRNVQMAVADGYVATSCASGPNGGAMGIHYVKPALLFDGDGTPSGEFEPTTPEILVYEPRPNGRLRLVAVEYIVFAEQWDAAHPDGESPVIEGHLMHYSGAPNRYRLPAFYELHVWAWQRNPNGTFADWNPRVSCDALGIA